MPRQDDQIALHIFTAIERPRSGRGCIACSAPEAEHNTDAVLASYAAARAASDDVSLALSCGHRSAIHAASSIWDYPADGAWCAQCARLAAIVESLSPGVSA